MRRIKMKRTKNKKKPLIILTAGGTGGHVYPAEALAEELEARGYRLALITDARGKDNYKGKLGEISNIAVWSGGIVGKSKLFKLKSLFKTCIGIMQAGYVLIKDKPACVVGFGGYASFPASMAALLAGVDLVLHEQNSVMSRTNRFLSKYATLIAQSFKKTKFAPAGVKSVLTGMPVRANIVTVGEGSYPELGQKDKMQLLILGGSQGAKVFGEVVPEAVKNLDEKIRKRLKIFQQCRKGDEDLIAGAYAACGAEVEVKHFFDNMADLYSQTHLIISRAGASSVSEIAVAGVPSILVPLPIAADDHQTSNAQEIADAKAGLLIKQNEFTAEKLKAVLEDLFCNYDKLKQMSDRAKKAGIKDAAKRLADAIEKNILAKR